MTVNDKPTPNPDIPIIRTLQPLLGPYAAQVEVQENRLIFGGQQASLSSKITGFILIALGLALYLAVLLQISGLFPRMLAGIGATILLYVGLFFVRYYHAVIFDQEARAIFLNTKQKNHRFSAFNDVRHFKETEHRQRGRYRATTLNVVLKDERELRLLTYKKDKLPENFPTEINRILWAWMNGRKNNI